MFLIIIFGNTWNHQKLTSKAITPQMISFQNSQSTPKNQNKDLRFTPDSTKLNNLKSQSVSLLSWISTHPALINRSRHPNSILEAICKGKLHRKKFPYPSKELQSEMLMKERGRRSKVAPINPFIKMKHIQNKKKWEI